MLITRQPGQGMSQLLIQPEPNPLPIHQATIRRQILPETKPSP
jgi:hypothetical protein